MSIIFGKPKENGKTLDKQSKKLVSVDGALKFQYFDGDGGK